MKKKTFKTALYHFRLAIGFAMAALMIAILPVSAERNSIVAAMEPYTWEIGD